MDMNSSFNGKWKNGIGRQEMYTDYWLTGEYVEGRVVCGVQDRREKKERIGRIGDRLCQETKAVGQAVKAKRRYSYYGRVRYSPSRNRGSPSGSCLVCPG